MPRQPLFLDLPDADHLGVYASDPSVERTKLRILSYEKNPRNIEAMVYSLSDKTLTELIRPCREVIDNWPQPVLYCPTERLKAETSRLFEDLKKKQPPPDESKTKTRSMSRMQALSQVQGDGEEKQTAIIRSEHSSGSILGSRLSAGRSVAQVLKDNVDVALESEEEDEDDNVPDDISVLSHQTRAEGSRFEIIPDFVLAVPVSFDMLQPLETPGPAPKGRAAEKETAAKDLARRYAAAYHVYGGRFLIHDAIGLVQEDKKNPPRRHLHPHVPERVLVDAVLHRLQEAEDDLCLYLFLIFLLEPKTQRLVARSVSGVFWRYAEFERNEIPLYHVPDNLLIFANRLQTEVDRQGTYKAKWANSTIYEVGTPQSDQALMAMRRKVVINLKAYCPKWREGKTPIWD
ncbi:hypothetical protein K525DRAFT_273490 [Schizophyllum commune Loenen D]|nr:hypothetical protein K525DRAFT_273490 [Schizophyllum commune Loenen D]